MQPPHRSITKGHHILLNGSPLGLSCEPACNHHPLVCCALSGQQINFPNPWDFCPVLLRLLVETSMKRRQTWSSSSGDPLILPLDNTTIGGTGAIRRVAGGKQGFNIQRFLAGLLQKFANTATLFTLIRNRWQALYQLCQPVFVGETYAYSYASAHSCIAQPSHLGYEVASLWKTIGGPTAFVYKYCHQSKP